MRLHDVPALDGVSAAVTFSSNARAERIMGRRREGVAIDQPCELDFHCPVCVYPLVTDGDYDERLYWSEYNFFLWCEVCNRDYPSALCQPDLDRAIEILLSTVAEAVRSEQERLRAAVEAIPPSHDAAHWGLAGHPTIIGADDQSAAYIRQEVLALFPKVSQ